MQWPCGERVGDFLVRLSKEAKRLKKFITTGLYTFCQTASEMKTPLRHWIAAKMGVNEGNSREFIVNVLTSFPEKWIGDDRGWRRVEPRGSLTV